MIPTFKQHLVTFLERIASGASTPDYSVQARAVSFLNCINKDKVSILEWYTDYKQAPPRWPDCSVSIDVIAETTRNDIRYYVIGWFDLRTGKFISSTDVPYDMVRFAFLPSNHFTLSPVKEGPDEPEATST